MHQKSCVPPAFLHQLLERAQLAGRDLQERAVIASTAPRGLGPVRAGVGSRLLWCSGTGREDGNPVGRVLSEHRQADSRRQGNSSAVDSMKSPPPEMAEIALGDV